MSKKKRKTVRDPAAPYDVRFVSSRPPVTGRPRFIIIFFFKFLFPVTVCGVGTSAIDAFARHDVIEHQPSDAAAEPGVHTDEAARRLRGGHRVAEGVYRQAHAGEDVEADGQGGQAVPALQDEPEELAAVHSGHIAGHVPAAQVHLHAVRE